MANNDQAPCFIVIGIVIIVMTLIIWWSPFFLIIGVGFIFGGICLAQQKVKRTGYANQTPSYQAQPVIQQSAPVAAATVPPQPVIEPERAKFCPHCGSPASDNFCSSCGSKIE
ncbi:MAG: hypothetical protein ACFFDK_14645 [Promethearchaeota archaeon]